MYSIKTVTSLTGISSETLRAWERRYGTVKPKRDAKGRRVYSQEDIDRLNLLCCATRKGFSISKIADLDNDDLVSLMTGADSGPSSEQEVFFNKIIDALQQYRMDLCEELLRRSMLVMEPLEYAQEIILPTLHRIGNLWHEGNISIAQEHMFSNSVKRLILSMVNSLHPFSGANPAIMFATLSGEHHEFGILLTSLLAAHQRCTCYYLGPDLPWQDLADAAVKLKPAAIIISLVNSPVQPGAVNELESLAARLPPDIQVWLGGVGAQNLSQYGTLPDRYIYISNLFEFNCRIQKLINEQP